MPQIIPLQAVKSQIVNLNLNGQQTTVNVYQKSTGLYADVLVNDTLIIGGVICWNANLIVRDVYLGFVGDLVVLDTQGTSDPDYAGLGSRYILVYYSPPEVIEFMAPVTAASGSPYSTGGELVNDGNVLAVTFDARYPSSDAGLAAGSIWSNGGVVCVVPGSTPSPGVPPIFFGSATPAGLLSLGGKNLPTTQPTTGSQQLWNMGGVVCIA